MGLIIRQGPLFPTTPEKLLAWTGVQTDIRGAAVLRPKGSATGSEEGSAAGVAAFTESASSTSFCLGGKVTSAGVRGEGSVPGAVSADGWGAHRARCTEATSVAAGAAGGCHAGSGETSARCG
jgi:hypothetical protein